MHRENRYSTINYILSRAWLRMWARHTGLHHTSDIGRMWKLLDGVNTPVHAAYLDDRPAWRKLTWNIEAHKKVCGTVYLHAQLCPVILTKAWAPIMEAIDILWHIVFKRKELQHAQVVWKCFVMSFWWLTRGFFFCLFFFTPQDQFDALLLRFFYWAA